VPELLFTFGLSYVIVELVQVVWGRVAVPYRVPAELDGPLFSVGGAHFPAFRAFMMLVALGHDVPRVFMLVFGGGCALAGLAGVVGGAAFVTEPGMAGAVGAVLFVVIVIGGMGSLAGAFIAALAIGCLQTFAVAIDASLAGMLNAAGASITPQTWGYAVWGLTLAQAAPVLPYLLLVLMLIVRPRGLMGTRED
jgi:branched-chain amino acid transport system permease protein